MRTTPPPRACCAAGGDGAVGREHLARLGVDVEAKGEAPLEARVLGDARGDVAVALAVDHLVVDGGGDEDGLRGARSADTGV